MDKIWISVIVAGLIVFGFAVFMFSENLIDKNNRTIVVTTKPVNGNQGQIQVLTGQLLPKFDYPNTLISGEELLITVTVENIGSSPGTGLQASITATNFSSEVSKTHEMLEPNAKTIFELSVPIEKYTLGWNSFFLSLTSNEFDPINQTFDVKILPNPDASIKMGISKSSTATRGENWNFKVLLENTGKIQLTNLFVELKPEPGIETTTNSKDKLDIGETVEFLLSPPVSKNAKQGEHTAEFIIRSDQTDEQVSEFTVTLQ